jgi:hypothetical protein
MSDLAVGIALFGCLFAPLVAAATLLHSAYVWVRDKLTPDWRQIK